MRGRPIGSKDKKKRVVVRQKMSDEERLRRKRERARTYARTHKDEIRVYQRAYKRSPQKGRKRIRGERERAWQRAYYQKNKDRINEQHARYRQKKEVQV